MRVRTAAATKEEVVAALDKANSFGPRLRSATTIAGLVAEQRGCRDSWATPELIRDYVSISSVKKVLGELVAQGNAYAVPGDHWAIGRGVNKKYTYYFTEDGKRQAIEEMTRKSKPRRETRRELWINEELRRAYPELVRVLAEQWNKDHPEPNWEERW
jgi:hypothetical protein